MDLLNLKGISTEQRPLDNYINASKLAQAFSKDINLYLRSDITKTFIKELKIRGSIKEDVVKREPIGIWFHPAMLLDFLPWLSKKLHADMALDLFPTHSNEEGGSK